MAMLNNQMRTWNERFLNILNSEIGDPWGPIATTCPCVVMRRGPFPKPYLDELSFFQPGESKMNGESVWNGETIMWICSRSMLPHDDTFVDPGFIHPISCHANVNQ